jgi:hypothetical protein
MCVACTYGAAEYRRTAPPRTPESLRAQLHAMRPDTPEQRASDNRKRMLQLLDMRWPKPPQTPQQRLLELYRLKGKWLAENC